MMVPQTNSRDEKGVTPMTNSKSSAKRRGTCAHTASTALTTASIADMSAAQQPNQKSEDRRLQSISYLGAAQAATTGIATASDLSRAPMRYQ